MRPRQRLLQLANELAEGQDRNIKCPFCMEDYENQNKPFNWHPTKSMSITKEGYTVLYNCFRASCTRGRGAIHILDGLHKSSIAVQEEQEKSFKPNYYFYKLQACKRDNLRGNTTLTQRELEEQHVRYAPDRKTVVFPIFDEVGHEVGVVDRSYYNRNPKTINYWFSDVPKIHFPIREGVTTDCVVLEDIPSAIKLSPYITSIALMGTNITSDCLSYLRGKFSVMYIALDEDATVKALQMAKRYRIFFKDVIALPLKKDVKNMNDKELDELFRRL